MRSSLVAMRAVSNQEKLDEAKCYNGETDFVIRYIMTVHALNRVRSFGLVRL
jgi:hypothetical protein